MFLPYLPRTCIVCGYTSYLPMTHKLSPSTPSNYPPCTLCYTCPFGLFLINPTWQHMYVQNQLWHQFLHNHWGDLYEGLSLCSHEQQGSLNCVWCIISKPPMHCCSVYLPQYTNVCESGQNVSPYIPARKASLLRYSTIPEYWVLNSEYSILCLYYVYLFSFPLMCCSLCIHALYTEIRS